MATNRQLLLDVASGCPEGCRLQLWADGKTFHIGAACDYCHGFLEGLVKEFFPDITTERAP